MGFFGSILELSAVDGTYIFIALLMFLLIFKAGLHILELYCHRNGFKELLDNLYREFMIMGLISFGVFVSNEAYDYANSSLYSAFHFAHMLILFIGLTFILQAILLIILVASRKGTLLRFSLISSHQLLDDYHNLMSSNSLNSLLFRNGPLSISFPELREKIENRILKDFFIRSFNLPEEFNFAIYTCRALKSYVISLSEVRPLNWFILALLAAVNYGKVSVLDERMKVLHCFVDNQSDGVHAETLPVNSGQTSRGITSYFGYFGSVDSGGRALSSAVHYTEAELCREYLLSYSVFCAFMLTLFLTSLLIASEVYMRRLLGKVLEMEIDLEWQDAEEIEEEAQEAEHELQFEKEAVLGSGMNAAHQDYSMSSLYPDSSPRIHTLAIIDPNPCRPFPPTPYPHTPSSPPKPSTQSHHILHTVDVNTQREDHIPAPSSSPTAPRVHTHFPSEINKPLNRSRSATSAPSLYHDEPGTHHRPRTQILERSRAASFSRARALTLNHGQDGHLNPHPREKDAPSLGQKRRMRSFSTLSSNGLASVSHGEVLVPRQPPESVIQEHQQMMREMGRGRANTFIKYMSDSLPVTLLSSRFLYQKCLERICRAEDNRHMRNSNHGAEINTPSSPVPPHAAADKTPEVYLNSGKEGYERNPLFLPPECVELENPCPQSDPHHQSNLPSYQSNPPSAHSSDNASPSRSFSRSSSRERDSGLRVNISNKAPRPVSRQRSFTAENILFRAAYQSQSRSMKCQSKDAESGSRSGTSNLDSTDHGDVETGTPPPRGRWAGTGSGVETAHEVPGSGLGLGLGGAKRSGTSSPPFDGMRLGRSSPPLGARPGNSSSSSPSPPPHSATLWPTASPEQSPRHSKIFPPIAGMEEDGVTEEKQQAMDGSSHSLDRDTSLNTAANSNAKIENIRSSKTPLTKASDTPHIPRGGDDMRVPKGRMTRAYSDIFFQMVPPETLKQPDTTIHLAINEDAIEPKVKAKQKYIIYDPNSEANKKMNTVSQVCSRVSWNVLVKLGYFFKCFMYGLYEILVLGPHAGGSGKHGQEESQDDAVQIALQKDLSSIFLFSNSGLYYRAIEFSLLLQCVYIALWCTNFAVVADLATNSLKWELFLVIPIPLNFFILKLVLNFACVLRSASVLDEEIAVTICEDALDERVVTQRLRKMVRTALSEIEPVKANWFLFLEEVFSHYVPESKPGVSTKQFTLLLHGIQIHLSKKSVYRIFKVIDFDQSGYITWTEFKSIVFPELFGPSSVKKPQNNNNVPYLVPEVRSVYSLHAHTNPDLVNDTPEITPRGDSNKGANNGAPERGLERGGSERGGLDRSTSRDSADIRARGVSFAPQRDRTVSFSEPTRDRLVSFSEPPRDRAITVSDTDRADKAVSFQHDMMIKVETNNEYYDDDEDSVEEELEDECEVEEEMVGTAMTERDEPRILNHLAMIEECEEEEED